MWLSQMSQLPAPQEEMPAAPAPTPALADECIRRAYYQIGYFNELFFSTRCSGFSNFFADVVYGPVRDIVCIDYRPNLL